MTEKEGLFNPTFENGGYWEWYSDLERQFAGILNYVPYLEGNTKTYSYRLANLILAVGAHVDSAFKEMAGYQEFCKEASCKEIKKRADDKDGIILSAIRAFDGIYGLSHEKVTFKCIPNRIEIMPFLEELPEWWTSYNNIKHDFSNNLSEATLSTVKDALAGAFLLNVIHKPARKRLFSYGLMKTKYKPTGYEIIFPAFDGEEIYREQDFTKPTINPFVIETSLFKYDYEKLKN